MKRALSILTACIAAGAVLPTYAMSHDPLDAKPHEAKKVVSTSHVRYKDAIYKDKKADDGLAWMDGLSGNFALVSNYVFRGISQTRNLPAVQGGLTYTFPYGFYASIWGSNVKFADSDATLELDGIIGWYKEFGDFSFDINGARYFYPSETSFNYNEVNALAAWRFLQFGISYSANVYNVHKSGTYYQGGVNWDIPPEYFFHVDGMNFTALFGHYNLPIEAGDTYNDYLVSVGKQLRNYNVSVIWTSTNGRQKLSPIDGSTFTFQVAADF